MRRRYAFEAEGVPEKVQTELEKLETSVDKKCDTPADCDTAIGKVEEKIEQFDGALSAMAGAAKDCKDGKCSKEEMGETIKASMTDLKNVAKSIGVANESDSETASEEEIQDAKAYLEGAKEILEAKKDELEGGGSSSEKGSSDEDGSDEDEAPAEECDAIESFVDMCLESYLDELDSAMESEIFDMAMEGTTSDAVSSFMQHKSQIKSIKAEMKAAEKAGNFSEAASKAKEAAGVADQIITDINNLPAQSIGKAALVNIALAVAAMIAAAAVVASGGALLKAAKGGAGKVGEALAKHAPQKLKGKIAAATTAHEINKNANVSDRAVKRAEKSGARSAQKDLNAKMKGARAELGLGVGNKVKGVAGKAAGAVSGVGNKIGGKASKIGQTITSHMVMAPGAEKVYDAASKVANSKVGQAAGKAAGAVGGAASAAKKPAAMGGAAGAAATAGAVLFLKKKGAVDADGNPTSSNLDGKDVNGVIALLKIDAKKLKQKYLDLAAMYEEAASNASSSSATESFLDALENFMINGNSVTEQEPEDAMESDTSFDSFLDGLWD